MVMEAYTWDKIGSQIPSSILYRRNGRFQLSHDLKLEDFNCRMIRELSQLTILRWIRHFSSLKLPALNWNAFRNRIIDSVWAFRKAVLQPKVNPPPFRLHQGMLGSYELIQNPLVWSLNPLMLLLTEYGWNFCNIFCNICCGLAPFHHNRVIFSVVRSIVP